MTTMQVLVVRVGAMGDVLHALPAVAALKRARPHWQIGWVIDPRWRPLLESDDGNRPVVDRVHVARTREWKRHPLSTETLESVLELRRELRGRGYEMCVDLQGSIRSAVIGWMVGTGRLIGADDPPERMARMLYTRRLEVRGTHVIEQGFELMEAALGEGLWFRGAELPVDGNAEMWCDEVVGDGAGLVFLAPTAGWGAKQWPAERYGEVARQMAAAGYRVIVNAAGDRDPVARRVVEASGGSARTLASGLGQMIALLRRVSLVIAGDTGPLHLAAALRRPVVGLYGPTDPARNGPYETRSRVLRDAGSVTDHRRHASTEAGLMRIGVPEVMRAAMDLLRAEETVGGGV